MSRTMNLKKIKKESGSFHRPWVALVFEFPQQKEVTVFIKKGRAERQATNVEAYHLEMSPESLSHVFLTS